MKYSKYSLIAAFFGISLEGLLPAPVLAYQSDASFYVGNPYYPMATSTRASAPIISPVTSVPQTGGSSYGPRTGTSGVLSSVSPSNPIYSYNTYPVYGGSIYGSYAGYGNSALYPTSVYPGDYMNAPVSIASPVLPVVGGYNSYGNTASNATYPVSSGFSGGSTGSPSGSFGSTATYPLSDPFSSSYDNSSSVNSFTPTATYPLSSPFGASHDDNSGTSSFTPTATYPLSVPFAQSTYPMTDAFSGNSMTSYAPVNSGNTTGSGSSYASYPTDEFMWSEAANGWDD